MKKTNHEKKWEIRPQYQEIQQILSPELGISPLLSQLLASRNITTPEDAEIFLSPKLSNLHSPFLMKDMEKAVDRICRAVKEREHIILYGDYDVDGVTGTSLLFLFLKKLGVPVSFFIPSRLEEGYGLHEEVLQKISEQGKHLLITIDCGISDSEQVRFAGQKGIDVIITDHHEVPEQLPPAYAVLNPKRPDCTFPFKGLAGVGVAFNLLMGLRKTLRDQGFFNGTTPPNLKQYLDLVALGTIADMVPLVDENRILVKYGLHELTHGNRIGIKALKEVCGILASSITSYLVAFRLAPRINAPGRLSQAVKSVELLTTDDYTVAQELALSLEKENSQRQQLEARIVREACKLIEATPHWEDRQSIVLAGSDWHPGVIGICASRVLDKYYKPSILISCNEEKGIGRGSARSPESFDLYEGLKASAHFLENYGGHRAAAGLTIELDRLDAFQNHFEKVVSESISQDDYVPSILIDAEVSLGEISEKLVHEISLLEPFGLCNPEPLLSSLAFDSYSSRVVGNGHLKMTIKEENLSYDAIGFNLAERFSPVLNGAPN
ncbi:MAG: single-stranded-DNA-specific exonuclease RecJ, partial [Thermodesulfobacteriota bacterium]|nr:single-stranded-DNA-specific exonuclease RecJ [Thermodesulfobacteriota bacterium]